jgi:hypothetical protein
MKRFVLVVAVLALCMSGTAYALYSVADKGLWPDTWPKELEPLRKQSRTLEGPLLPQLHYEIPFTKRDEFEAAWPHLLKVKSKGAPIILVRSPLTRVFKLSAGVVIHTPPRKTNRDANPEAPIPGSDNARSRWMWTNYIELVVDGDIVDLNRIPLPADTPIIDERFEQPR